MTFYLFIVAFETIDSCYNFHYNVSSFSFLLSLEAGKMKNAACHITEEKTSVKNFTSKMRRHCPKFSFRKKKSFFY